MILSAAPPRALTLGALGAALVWKTLGLTGQRCAFTEFFGQEKCVQSTPTLKGVRVRARGGMEIHTAISPAKLTDGHSGEINPQRFGFHPQCVAMNPQTPGGFGFVAADRLQSVQDILPLEGQGGCLQR